MIRLLHAADLHLDSPFQSLTARQALERRAEQRQLPARIAALAREKRADILVFAGDVFDSDALFSETGRSIERALAGLDIPVFFAPGNHDWYSRRSLWSTLALGERAHVFTSGQMECVALPDLGARVWGSAFTSRSRRAPLADFEAEKDGDLVDIMVLHGDVGQPGSPYGPITDGQLERSGMDYVALGHSHTFSGLRRAGETFYAWPGCAEGRGFDECGEKGFVLLTVEDGSVAHEFVPFSARQLHRVPVDITGLTQNAQIAQRMKEQSLGLSPEDMVEFLLTGESDPTADISAPYLQQTLQGSFFFVKVKDESHLALDADAYRNDVSLKGEFIRQVLASELTDADKAAVIRAGLQALSGEEISL